MAQTTVTADRIAKATVAASVVRASARAPQWVVPLIKAALVVADSALATAAFALAFYWREGGPLIVASSSGTVSWTEHFAPYGALLLFVVLIRLLVLKYYDLYRLRGNFPLLTTGYAFSKPLQLDRCSLLPRHSSIAEVFTTGRFLMRAVSSCSIFY